MKVVCSLLFIGTKANKQLVATWEAINFYGLFQLEEKEKTKNSLAIYVTPQVSMLPQCLANT